MAATTAKRTVPAKAKAKADGLAPLIAEVRNLIQSARRGVSSVIDTFQVMTNFEIGRRIVEHEQKGEKRAGYGQELLKLLSVRLSEEFGRGFSPVNLSHMRRFYLTWQDRMRIFQSVTEESGSAPFLLSWTHYVELLGIKDADERSFYEIESANSGWNVRELKRQKASCLYERLALSRDKAGVKRLAEKGQIITKPEDVLKEPYVLEFLGLEDRASYSESDLESALISQLERFLLELGRGFLFEARQRRFTFDGDHYFLDLVFYNRLLRCYVVIDLKLDKLTHQDLGQMQMSALFNAVTDGDHLPPPKSDDGVTFLTIGNITTGKLDFEGSRFVSETYYQGLADFKRPVRGDILYTVVGATYGRPALVETDRPFCVQRHLAILKPPQCIDVGFLMTVLRSPLTYEQAAASTTGTAQPTIPLGSLRRFRAPLPPLAEQRRIAARVDQLMVLVDELEAQLAASRATAASLLSAVVAELTSSEQPS